jgi:hypothetical protein
MIKDPPPVKNRQKILEKIRMKSVKNQFEFPGFDFQSRTIFSL